MKIRALEREYVKIKQKVMGGRWAKMADGREGSQGVCFSPHLEYSPDASGGPPTIRQTGETLESPGTT